MAVNIAKLKKQLMDRVDVDDLVVVEKVERYINMIDSFRRVNKLIEDEGETIVTENGSQRFTKAHPLIGERNKINASLLNIERSFGFEPETPGTENERSGNDLI